MSYIPEDLIDLINSKNEIYDVAKVCPTGSAVIIGPDKAQDLDVLVYMNMDAKNLVATLEKLGYVHTNKREYPNLEHDDEFYMFRRGRYNLITTNNIIGYNRWVTATTVAVKLNLTEKADRIKLFRSIVNGDGVYV